MWVLLFVMQKYVSVNVGKQLCLTKIISVHELKFKFCEDLSRQAQ